MRLGDMNTLGSNQLNEDMKTRVGWNFGDISRLSIAQASAMLEHINEKISKIKTTKQLHESQNNAVYNGLIIAKQVLESYISERAVSKSQQQAAGAALAAKRGDAPKSKLKGSSKAMMKMSTKELEKIAGTKHKGLPEKVKESKETITLQHKTSGKEIVVMKTAKQKIKDLKDNGYNVVKESVKEGINESAEFKLNEAYTRAEQMVDSAFTRMLSRLNAMTKMTRSGGSLAISIDSIGGDPSYLKDAQEAIDAAYDAVGEAHYGAMAHIVDEGATQGVFEDEVGQAETLMAAQDMVDSIQGMLEDVGEMINEKLPPLTDSIRRTSGAEAAATFNSQTNEALNSLMDAVRTAREAMANAVGSLTGEAPTPMTSVDTVKPAGGTDEITPDSDAEFDLDDFGASDAAVGGEEPLGRSKRI